MDTTLSPLENILYTTAFPEKRSQWEALGMQLLSEGRVAVLLLAGGQGTRLGFDKPKGMYRIGAPVEKTLFQLQAERLLSLCEQANRSIALYVMCSSATLTDTVTYFEEQKYFGIMCALIRGRSAECIFFSAGGFAMLWNGL